MPIKEIFAPSLGHNVKFGRQIPKTFLTHPMMAAFEIEKEKIELPTPPNTIDWTPAALSCLQQLFLNDQLGDCVIAAIMHALGIWTGNAGNLVTASNGQVLAAYEAIGGYVPENPNTDNGCNIQTMLTYYMNNPLPDGSKLLGYVGVDPTNQIQVMRAIDLFENLILGLALPDAWVNPFPSGTGFVWDVAGDPDPNNGHCIVGGGGGLPNFKIVGYTADGVVIVTWGMLGILTWNALAKYAVNSASGECYSALNEDIVSKKGGCPNGYNWLALVQYWNAMGGKVPVPAPVPAPTPTPVPTPIGQLTVAQVLSWLAAAFKTAPAIELRNQALQIAQKAIANNWPAAKGPEIQRILKARNLVVTDAEIEAVLKINKNPSFRRSWEK